MTLCATLFELINHAQAPSSVSFFRADYDSWTITLDYADSVELKQMQVPTAYANKCIAACRMNEIPFETWSQY
jgi:hypothetical protein